MDKITVEPSELIIKTHCFRICIESASYEPPRIPWVVEKHSHNSYEMHFITKGKGTLLLDNERYELEKGIFYITGPSVFHSQISDDNNPMEEYGINITIRQIKDDIASDVDALLKKICENPFFIASDDFGAAAWCGCILEDILNVEAAADECIKALTTALLISVGRKISGAHTKIRKTNNNRPNMMRVLDLCLRKFTTNISASEVASSMFISRRHLSRIMNEVYGMSFSKKIASMRVSYAKELLKSSTLSIQQIAEKSGFSSSQIFCKTFKKITGITPREYKKSCS
ncbi:MAG: helix-turn-helix domain-containing protein [Ruminococcaceae bacterium]|nr:helix-turn-helix domain-containing protein [Oscillospiraceae bacterium]